MSITVDPTTDIHPEIPAPQWATARYLDDASRSSWTNTDTSTTASISSSPG